MAMQNNFPDVDNLLTEQLNLCIGEKVSSQYVAIIVGWLY